MFNKEPGLEPSSNKSSYDFALSKLKSEVLSLEKDVLDTKNNLLETYHREGLVGLRDYFEEISSRFIKYIRNRSSKHYDILQRGKERLDAAKQVRRSAKKTAKMFERFARNPNRYSRIDSRLQIDELLEDIRNLKSFC